MAEGKDRVLIVDSNHGIHWIRRSTDLHAGLGVSGLNQIEKSLPRQYHLHFSEKLLLVGLLFGSGELVIRVTELFAAHQPTPGL